MTTATKVPAAQQRTQIYGEMTEPLQKIADFIELRKQQLATGAVKACYQIGKKIIKVLDDQTSYGEGVEAIKKLADYTGLHRSKIYACRELVEIYPEWDKLEEIVEEPLANGDRMTETHLFAVIKLSRAADRNKLIRRIQKESLSAKETIEEANAGFEKKNTRSGGRPPKRPTSPRAGFQQIFSEAQKMNNRFDKTWGGIFTEVKEMEPDSIDPELLSQAEKANDQLDALEQHIMQSRVQLNEGLTRMKRVIDKRVSDNKTAKKTSKKKASESRKPKPLS